MTALDWLTTTHQGWATYPLALVVGLLFAALSALVVVRAERRRLDGDAHEASLQLAAAMRERDADEVVGRYVALGMTPDAIRRAAHGGPAWCAAVDRALARRGPTGTQASAPPRGGS